MKRRERAALLGLLILGALLRFGGMSHDLHESRIYHPDSPKQIIAVQRFVSGRYFEHVGNRTLDGYPLFHAHLAEYLVRVVEPVRRGALELVGVPFDRSALPQKVVLYWVMLGMNATLSTATILLVFRAGREHFGPGLAWVAAGFQTVSPIDVTAAHMATGDATAAFFSALSLFFALRIHSRGYLRDYALAAAVASCGFAAKYYAAMAFFPILAAHLARAGRPGAWFGVASLWRLGVTAVAAVVGLFLAIPTLFNHFLVEMRSIIAVITVSGSRPPNELGKDPSRWQIFRYGQTTNLLVLARLLSPPAVAALLAGFGTRARRDPRFWILLVGPAAYWIFGVGSRAQVHPVFHAVITAPLFLLTALCVGEIWRAQPRWSRVLRPAAAAVVAGGIAILAADALREVFFWWHMDTRRVSAAWVAENVPHSFRANRTRYNFAWEGDDSPETTPARTLYQRSAVGELPAPPETAIPLKRFVLERKPLTIFRNIGQDAYLEAPGLIRPGFSLPVSQRWPSQTGNQFIFDNGLDFLRSEKLLALEAGGRADRWLVREAPLREAWIVAQVVAAPATVSVRFGGESKRLEVGVDRSAVIHLAAPRPQFPSGDGLFFYRLRVSEPTSLARVLLATRPGEAGRMLFNAGRYAAAAPLLDRAAREEGDAAAAAEALIAARIAGLDRPVATAAPLSGPAARALAVSDEETIFAAYGIRAAYLDTLPFLSLQPQDLGRAGFRLAPRQLPADNESNRELVLVPRLAEREGEKGARVWTGDLMLDPGHYRAAVALRAPRAGGEEGELRAVLVDVRETVTLSDRVFRFPALETKGYDVGRFDFAVPPGVGAVRLSLRADQPLNLAIGGLEIRPDIMANALGLAATLRAAIAADCSAAAGEPLAYDLLQALGAAHAGSGAAVSAAECYAVAAALLPGRTAPLEALTRLLPGLPAARRPEFEAIVAKGGAAR